MDSIAFKLFQKVVRKVHLYSDEEIQLESVSHPFDERNIHSKMPKIVKELFDDGYFALASFEAFKFLDKQVGKIAKSKKSGFKLMMEAFKDNSPLIQINELETESEIDEQKGYCFIFAGSTMAIRNPRGHEHSVEDSLEACLDHLSLASLLLRRLEEAGLKIPAK